MRRFFLASLVVLAIAALVWLSSDNGGRSGLLQTPASVLPAHPTALERVEGHLPAERHELEPRRTDPETSAARSSAPATSETEDGAIFHGRVVDALDQRPIPGAKALLARGGYRRAVSEPVLDLELEAESDADGRFVLAGRAVKHPRYGLILREGYGPLLFAVGPGHETATEAAWLELLPAARLEVLATNHQGEGLPGIEVELRVERGPLMQDHLAVVHWGREFVESVITDPGGRAVFDSLPAETLLELRFARGERDLAAVESLALRPGEQRSIERTIGLGKITGRVVDQDGVAVDELYLWRACTNPAGSLTLHEGAVEQGATSDEHGEFSFWEVPYGTWLIGPSVLHTEDVAPSGTLVTVDRPEIELELRVTRGPPIAGRLLDADGVPCAGEWVWARRPGDEDDGLLTETDGEGFFRFASVEFGRYELVGGVVDFSSEPLMVDAGTIDVVLRAQQETDVHLFLPNLGRSSAWVTVLDPATGSKLETSSGKERCDLRLASGTYSIFALATGDRIAARTGLVVDPSRMPGELVLELLPGARLTVVNGDAGSHELFVLVTGGPLYREDLAAGTSAIRLVPAGEVRVELRDGERVVAGETVTLAPRERRRLVLAPE